MEMLPAGVGYAMEKMFKIRPLMDGNETKRTATKN